MTNKWIGQSVERLEDPPLVRGHGRFAGDIVFPHQLCMRLVRSNHAHGRIVSIDTTEARALPGVVAVWTADDIADVPPIDFREGRIEKLEPYRQPVLATGRVRFVGDPVAAVFAADPYVAEDAADLVTVEIEELPAVLDASAPPSRVFARPHHRGRHHPPGLRRRRGGAARRARHGRTRTRHRPPFRRAAWKRAAQSAATMPSRDIARTARRRQGAAPHPRTAVADAEAAAVVDPRA